jgi:hypothetical protein
MGMQSVANCGCRLKLTFVALIIAKIVYYCLTKPTGQNYSQFISSKQYDRAMDRLQQIHEQIAQQKNPPVHTWKPSVEGEIDISIDEQANWYHEGDPILRNELVKLFASILWFENGEYYLVTPVEKLRIQVEDVPFSIQQLERLEHQGGVWVATTNTQEKIVLSEKHPVELRQYGEALLPYVRVRYGLWARPTRSIYYQWVTDAMEQTEDAKAPHSLCLQSGGYEFEIGRLD